MADQIPGCCDTTLELLRKIVLQFQSMASGLPNSLLPVPTDDKWDLYRKWLATLSYLP